MFLERPLHPDVKALLMSQEPFQYAHLIKFERPSRPDSNTGTTSTAKQRYTYITDASKDIPFDDGSTDTIGNRNGVQTYIANKVLKVSSVQEDTEAKASSYAVSLDGNGLGAYISGQAKITEITTTSWSVEFLAVNTDLVAEGFREGDKVTLEGTDGFNTVSVNIVKFLSPSKITVTSIDTAPQVGTGPVVMELSSDEIVSILQDKNAPDYASFINREVFIYRAYFKDHQRVGNPFLLFKGIISGVNFDDTEDSLVVTWSMTSHWGDFSQVKGRITSDDFHRALDQNGVPQPQSAIKVSYAYDKGFSHAETSINILAQYSVQVEKQDVSVKKGFLGIGSKVKVKKYYATESRNTELDFQLQAKSIPLIYGVRNTAGIPIFADTLKNDSSTVYTIQVLSEGEIGGLYDCNIEGNSLICNDKADFDVRSKQTTTDTVQLICRGRADRGDVLGGVSSISNTTKQFYDTYYSNPSQSYKAQLDYDYNYLNNYQDYVEPTVTNTDTTGAGIVDGQSINLSSPQDITIDFFSGKPGQKAASSLVAIAKANNFKIQNDYWDGINTADYWGPNHRLLDSAYVVNKFKIKEGESTIPTIEYVVKGKIIDCYNYDKSYSHYNKATGENAANFKLGEFVDLVTDSGAILLSSVQIIDKWTFRNSDGTPNTRFRFSVDPPLQYVNGVPQITKFKMVKGENTWTMITYNFKELESTNTKEWLTTITGVSNNNGYVQIQYADAGFATGRDPQESSGGFSVVEADGSPVDIMFFSAAVLVGDITGNSIKTKYSWTAAGPAASKLVGKYLVRRDAITIPNGSATDGYYNGAKITVTRTDTFTGKRTSQTKTIRDYTSGVATIDSLWDYQFHPKNGDVVSVTQAYADSRVSINPAIQLMDYVTSPTYGRGLHYTRDLNFSTWLSTARRCDEQSNVTVQATENVAVTAGSTYRWPSAGDIIWQGNVVGSSQDYIEFEAILGKLSYAWNSWRTFEVNELVYVDNKLYRVTTRGTIPTKPTASGGNLVEVTSLDLTKTNGAGPATISLKTDGNPVRALKDGSIIPGYSLYDADGVDYWRYLGWDEFNQRYVTKHQTNIVIDTSLPMFDNVNSLLEHFGGILRYAAGKYDLDLEEAEGPISQEDSEVRHITADHIIGKIRLNDDGIRSSYNSLTAAYADPANKFESRNISFFNSDYLRADKNVPKKGSIVVPGITNYYNTRLIADRTLNKSRYSLQASFNMSQRGTLLMAGHVIQLQHPRYNWDAKKFRIQTLTHLEDATVDLVVEEYDDSLYGLSNISKQAASGLAGSNGSVSGIGSPTNMRVSSFDTGDETNSAVTVTWQNSPDANTKNVSTEVYSSYSPNLYVEVRSIQDNALTTVQNPHGLRVGELITSTANLGGLAAGRSYFIKSIPAANTLQLSETKGGPIIGLTNTPDISIMLQTANLVATVAVPTNSYVDVFGGIDERVIKYYWVRHKVVQGT